MLQVYSTCKQFLRTFPSLCLSETNVEELEDGQEDHTADSLAHACMSRCLPLTIPAKPHSASERDFLIVQGRQDEIIMADDEDGGIDEY